MASPVNRGRSSVESDCFETTPAIDIKPTRTFSYSSGTSDAESTLSASLQKTNSGWIKPAPTVNVHTTCGRHTDQLLFGGPSLSGLARALLGKNK